MKRNTLTVLAGGLLALAALSLPGGASACPDGDKKPKLQCPDGDKKPKLCPDGDKKPKLAAFASKG